LVTVTVALAIPPPFWSWTTPVIEPLFDWAKTPVVRIVRRNDKIKVRVIGLLIGTLISSLRGQSGKCLVGNSVQPSSREGCSCLIAGRADTSYFQAKLVE